MGDSYHINFDNDLTPAFALLGGAIRQRKADRRSDEYMQMEREAIKARAERESAAVARQKAEDDRKHAIEAYSALPALQRAALKSVPMANANPYGVKFSETMESPDQGKADAAVGGFLANDQPPEQAPAHARQLMPTEEGPEQAPDAEASRFASPDDLMSKATRGAPLDMLSQAAASSFGPPTRHVRGSYAGQQFEVQPQSETSGFGEKYDAMFNALVEGGEEPHKARAFIAAQAKQDMADTARDKRLADAIAGRNTNREDQQTFMAGENQKYRSTAEERDKLARIAANARVAASAPELKVDTANRQDMGTLRQGFKDWKNTVNLSIDSKSHKRLATAMSNLNSGNSMQQREAAESLVSIFKGGGQVTKASQDLLLKHLAGIVGDVQTWMQHAVDGGFGARELAVLQQATRNALAEEKEKLHGYHQSAAKTFGPGSGYEQLGANVNAMVGGAFEQFGGDDEGSIYPDATEPVVLGSGKRPKAPKAKPTIPHGAVMGTMHGKRGYVLNGKFTPVE